MRRKRKRERASQAEPSRANENSNSSFLVTKWRANAGSPFAHGSARASLTSTVATKPNEHERRNATRPLFRTTLYRPVLSIIVYHRVYRTLFLSLLQRSFIGTLYCALYCALFHRYTASRIIPTYRDLVNDSIVELTTRRNRVIIWISGFDGIVLLIGRHRRLTFTFRARV